MAVEKYEEKGPSTQANFAIGTQYIHIQNYVFFQLLGFQLFYLLLFKTFIFQLFITKVLCIF